MREALLGIANATTPGPRSPRPIARLPSCSPRRTPRPAELLDRARARSAEDAAELVAAEHARMLREARSFELAARRAAYDALLAAAVAAVRARLADDPEVLAALTARAHAALGPEATVTRSSRAAGWLPRPAVGGWACRSAPSRSAPSPSCSPPEAHHDGAIIRVSGPLVEVEGLAGVAMFELVDLGPERLAGEVVGIRDDVLVVQAYEYTGGLRPGDPARARR